jgi:broad specificity phosphatase PhoE
MATELILIRHGQAVRILGDYEHAPLTELGRKQAKLTGLLFCHNGEKFDGFYSSPLRRAKETAAIIGSEMGQIPAIKTGVQELEGTEVPQLLVFEFFARAGWFGKYLYENSGKPMRWPIIGRISVVLTELINTHPNQCVTVVAHSGVISAVLAWYFPSKRGRWWRYTVDNCSVTRLRVEGSRAEALTLNDTRHLSAELTTTQPPAAPVETAKKM